MKGYLAFLLVFVSSFFILTIMQSYYAPGEVYFPKAIAAERSYQALMNSKEAVLEGIREGAIEGVGQYSVGRSTLACNDPELGGPFSPNCFRIDEAKIWAKAGAYLKLVKLCGASFDPSMDLRIFCTGADSLSDDEARDIALSIRERGQYCPGCAYFRSDAKGISWLAKDLIEKGERDSLGNPVYSEITGPQCMEALIPEFRPAMDPLGNPELEKISLGKVIAASVYYRDFNISAVSYLPAGYGVEP